MSLIPGGSRSYRRILLFFLAEAGFACFTPACLAQYRDTVVDIRFTPGNHSVDKGTAGRLVLAGETKRADVRSVTGRADSIGSAAANQSLSAARVFAVMRILHAGFTTDSVRLFPLGESSPLSKTDLAANRSVQVVLRLYDDKPPAAVTAMDHDTVLPLPDIHFQPDLPAIASSSLDAVVSLAARLKSYPCARFDILGYVNWIENPNFKHMEGLREKMFALSEKRAKAIYELLLDQGIPASVMRYAGRGNDKLKFASPATESEERENMRVLVIVHRHCNP